MSSVATKLLGCKNKNGIITICKVIYECSGLQKKNVLLSRDVLLPTIDIEC